LLGLAAAQLLPSLRASWPMAVAGVVTDTAAVFATLALYSFDPRRYLPALVVVVQAEAGVVLGLVGGFAAWVVTSAAYFLVEALSQSASGAPAHPVDVAIRIAVGLILAMGGGFLSGELSGERARRIAEREEELRLLWEAEEKYRVLVEQIPVVTYIDAVDARSSTVYISPQVDEMVGYGPDAWTSDPHLWAKLLHPDDRDRVLEENDRTNETGEPFRVEYRLVSRDGREVWVRDEATLVRDGEGRPRFWQGVMYDITE